MTAGARIDGRIEPAFIAGPAGGLFTMAYRPRGPARGALLVVPPFAEEMNRVRRTVAVLARELMARGFETIVPDLHGTGDSAGDFVEARWSVWGEELVSASRQAHADSITHVLAIRSGALLAFDAIRGNALSPRHMLLWQPALDGKRVLDQFLRLRVAAEMGNASGARTSVAQLRQRLEGGESVEVAGYELHPRLAAALDAQAVEPTARAAALTWLEVGAAAALSVPAERSASAFRAAGWRVDAHVVAGAPVWSTPETTVNGALVEATVRAIVDEQ